MDGEPLDRAIRGAQQGDGASLDWLIEHFASRIYGFLYRMTGSQPDAEDLMQEVFVRLVRMIGAYQHDGRFEAWIFRIAANLARDRLRRLRRGPRFVGSLPTQDEGEHSSVASLQVSEPAVDAGLLHAEEMVELGIALAKLPDAERETVMLRHFSQMSYKEIAEATGVPLGTALARGHRGLNRLRQLMTGGAATVETAGISALSAGE